MTKEEEELRATLLKVINSVVCTTPQIVLAIR
jgi:hypothetical protein